MLLHGGPGDGQVVPGGDDTIVWRACLYEITPEYGHRHGHYLRVYRHRPLLPAGGRCMPSRVGPSGRWMSVWGW